MRCMVLVLDIHGLETPLVRALERAGLAPMVPLASYTDQQLRTLVERADMIAVGSTSEREQKALCHALSIGKEIRTLEDLERPRS